MEARDAGLGLLSGFPRGWRMFGLLGAAVSGLNTLVLILLAYPYASPMYATRLIVPVALVAYFAARRP